MKKLVLASSSPRRIEILNNLKLKFQILPSGSEEIISDDSPEQTVLSLSKQKAMDVSSRASTDSIVIGADTIVVKDGRIFGKPSSEKEAIKMLRELSGNSHSVMTGICIIDNNSGRIIQDFEETRVFFKRLSDDEIRSYIKTGEYRDKAGAYGIQGFGGLLVERINGCYFNVVGLPLNLFYRMMGELGVNLLAKEVENGD